MLKYRVCCNISIIYILFMLGNDQRYSCIDYYNMWLVSVSYIKLDGDKSGTETVSDSKARCYVINVININILN